MKDSLTRRSFDIGSSNYGKRVHDPLSRWLRTEEWIVVEFLKSRWTRTEPATLVDAGCGSGDRLKLLFTDGELPREWFDEIIGLDFSTGMLEQAQKKTLDGRPLYDELHHADLTEAVEHPRGDAVLCLWSIPNLVRRSVDSLMTSLGNMVRPGGLVACDVMVGNKKMTDLFAAESKVVQEREPEIHLEDEQTFLRSNEDGTFHKVRLFSLDEIAEFSGKTGLELCEVWAYMHGGLGITRVEADGGVFPRADIPDYTGLMLCFQSNGGAPSTG